MVQPVHVPMEGYFVPALGGCHDLHFCFFTHGWLQAHTSMPPHPTPWQWTLSIIHTAEASWSPHTLWKGSAMTEKLQRPLCLLVCWCWQRSPRYRRFCRTRWGRRARGPEAFPMKLHSLAAFDGCNGCHAQLRCSLSSHPAEGNPCGRQPPVVYAFLR